MTIAAPGYPRDRVGLRRGYVKPRTRVAPRLPVEPRPHDHERPLLVRFTPIATQRPQNIRTRHTGWHTFLVRADGMPRGEHAPVHKTARPVLRRVPRPWYAGTELT